VYSRLGKFWEGPAGYQPNDMPMPDRAHTGARRAVRRWAKEERRTIRVTVNRERDGDHTAVLTCYTMSKKDVAALIMTAESDIVIDRSDHPDW
jgi:hypothetical protein